MAFTGVETSVPLPPLPDWLPDVWLVGAQLFDWLFQPPTPALTPQTFTPGLRALIGAETTDEPVPVDEPLLPFAEPLLWPVGAQVLVWLFPPSAPALTPQAFTFGLPALTGSDT